jgi:hypothetical protein
MVRRNIAGHSIIGFRLVELFAACPTTNDDYLWSANRCVELRLQTRCRAGIAAVFVRPERITEADLAPGVMAVHAAQSCRRLAHKAVEVSTMKILTKGVAAAESPVAAGLARRFEPHRRASDWPQPYTPESLS